MKKIILIILSLLIIFTFLSCDGEPPEEPGNLCLITYDKNGGEFVSSPFTKARKDTYVSIPEIRKTGYTLESWKGAEKAEDGTWGLTMKGYDVTLKAIWNAESHKISYNLNGGRWTTDPPADSALMDQDVYLDEKPSLDGSHFVKWTSDDVSLNLTKYGYHFRMPSHDVSLKAEYSAGKYGISYDLDGGTFGEYWYPESAYKDEEVFIVASPVRTGYVFDGWESVVEIKKDDDIYSFIMPHNNIALKAKWKPESIELKWFEIGDKSVATEAETGRVINLPTDLVKENYQFKEWRVVPNTLSQDGKTFRVQPIDDKNKYMTIYALWEGKEYTINYENVEESWKASAPQKGNLFNEVIIPELNKDGFVVTGWTSSDPNVYIEKLPGEGGNAYRLYRMSGESAITLTPVYEVEINYDLVHENARMIEEYTSTTIPYSVIRLPNCECKDYRFLGWKNRETGARAVELEGGWYIPVDDKSITVEALWEKVYSVKFYNGDELMYNYEIVDGKSLKMPYPNTTGPNGSVFITWYNMDAGPGNYVQVKEIYKPSTSVSFKAVWGYPLEGHLVYDDPDARNENIVYTFFNWMNEWIPYNPSKIGDPNYPAYYYSIELRNGATITKDRFYVISACPHNPQTRGDAAWTYFANGKWKHGRVGATKTEIGGGRYNTQLVLGLIKEGEEAKRGIANINIKSPYTQPNSDKGDNYTIWISLQQLNQKCVHHDWYIPSKDEALQAMKIIPGRMTWTSTEPKDDLDDDVFCIRYYDYFEQGFAEKWPKVPFEQFYISVDYMRSF